jgi:pyrroloquinoline quinone biosynthesis protein B
VLGSGAGGGVPQWNCGCDNCELARAGDPRVARRTQDSIALTGTGDRWLIVNASPDILRQIETTRAIQPRGLRHTPIAAVALTNGDLDHVVGLLSMRESQHFAVLATERVRAGLVERNVMLRTLARTPDQVSWQRFELGRESILPEVGLGVMPLSAPGKLPVHLVGVLPPSPEDNVALRIRDLSSGRIVALATAFGSLEAVPAEIAGSDLLFFDGTFWSEDELPAAGLGKAHARDMAHVPIGGPRGSLARLSALGGRRIFTHLNNTNPVLRQGSPEHEAAIRAGWEIAFDGMEIEL